VKQSGRWRGVVVVSAVALAACSTASSPTTSRHIQSSVPYTMATVTTIPVNNSAHLAVSSTQLTVGKQITVSGTGCPAGSSGTVDLSQTLNDANFDPLDDGNGAIRQPPTAPVVNGSWTVSMAVPMLEEGSAVVTGSCGTATESSGTTRFRYPNVPVTVVLADHLTALPSTTVNAGTTLTVSPVNGGCDPGAPYVTFDDPTGASAPVFGNPTIGAGHRLRFPVTIVVPPSTRPGTYRVDAFCSVDNFHTYSGAYQPLTITVG
jgi:hypothetical protein